MMIYQPQIRRRYPTYDEAWRYLVGRGFNCLPRGNWENGRWAATVTYGRGGCDVLVQLRA